MTSKAVSPLRNSANVLVEQHLETLLPKRLRDIRSRQITLLMRSGRSIEEWGGNHTLAISVR